MDNYGRRNRRGRQRSRPMRVPLNIEQGFSKSSLVNNICSFLIMSCLIAIIFLMLEYHSNVCNKKCDIYNITRSIDDIEHNISTMKSSYYDLEQNVLKFSQDLPKIEGQVEILEALAHSMERGDFMWTPKNHLALPNVDVIIKTGSFKELELNNMTVKNITTN